MSGRFSWLGNGIKSMPPEVEEEEPVSTRPSAESEEFCDYFILPDCDDEYDDYEYIPQSRVDRIRRRRNGEQHPVLSTVASLVVIALCAVAIIKQPEILAWINKKPSSISTVDDPNIKDPATDGEPIQDGEPIIDHIVNPPTPSDFVIPNIPEIEMTQYSYNGKEFKIPTSKEDGIKTKEVIFYAIIDYDDGREQEKIELGGAGLANSETTQIIEGVESR